MPHRWGARRCVGARRRAAAYLNHLLLPIRLPCWLGLRWQRGSSLAIQRERPGSSKRCGDGRERWVASCSRGVACLPAAMCGALQPRWKSPMGRSVLLCHPPSVLQDSVTVIVQTSATAINAASTATAQAVAQAAATVCNGGSVQAAAQSAAQVLTM